MTIDLVLWILLLWPLVLYYTCILQIILLVRKKIILYMREKKEKNDMGEIFMIENIRKNKKQPNMEYDQTIYFTILLYYSFVLTVTFWPRHCYVLGLNDLDFIDGFDNIFVFYLLLYLVCFVPCCFIFIRVPSVHHLTEAEAVSYLTGPIECQCLVTMECYHTDIMSEYSVTSTSTFKTNIQVPIVRLLDKGKGWNQNQI